MPPVHARACTQISVTSLVVNLIRRRRDKDDFVEVRGQGVEWTKR